ncbi:MAG: hypothetical protein LBF55_06420 [Prevotellaceae bacterium]|jgi:tetratricopeptide (TPR) repeat protein|nr:hypothetical protein [Prevotellaceae bacterium]
MRRSLLALALTAAAAFAPAASSAQPDAELPDDDATIEALQALRYDRCLDALNMLLDKERGEDTLSRIHRRLKAEAFACLGSHETALALYSSLLRDEADNPQYLFRRAQLHGALGRWKKAHRDCARLRLLTPSDDAHCKRCGEYALNARKYKEAVAFLSRHLLAREQDTEAQYLLALAHQGQKNLTQALLLINACLAANPAEGKYYAARALLYEQTEALRFAANDYQTYLTKKPADHSAWLRYAHLLRRLGRTREACGAFEQSEAHGNLDAGKHRHRYCR